MSGICGAHKHHEPGCPRCEAICSWVEQDEGECWETSCGKIFVFNYGSPSENGMIFCCYCGKPLVEAVKEVGGKA